MLSVPIGEGGIRTRGTGLTRYDGLANRPMDDVNSDHNDTYDTSENVLADCLALLRKKSPDLALVVERWHSLSADARRDIRAIIESEG